MKVRVTWEFDVDVEELNPKFVDISGLAEDLAKRELDYLLTHGELTADEFEYTVICESGEEN